MGQYEERWEENAKGRFFVDRECIDCDLCRSTAPENFRRSPEGHSYVAVQPHNAQQKAEVELAMNECPVDAIGDQEEGS